MLYPSALQSNIQHPTSNIVPLVLALLLWLRGAAPAPAQEWELDLDALRQWVDVGAAAAADGLGFPTDWEARLNDVLRAQAPVILKAVDDALHELDPEAMSELQPILRQVAAHAREVEALKPYADWFETRLDYFDAARRAVALAPAPKPPKPVTPPVRPPTRPGTTPPPPVRPPKATVPEAVRQKRIQLATDAAGWRKRLKDRPAPKRAADLAPVLKAAFRAERIPEALVWMAEVESTMNPAARSPVGAAGLFQLMPGTAESLGLSLKPVDERFDARRNASAAARYLRQLHGRFGNWPLTLAAYNAGEGKVSGLLRKQKQKTFDAIASGLPIETRMYVPRVLETIRLREKIDPAKLAAPQ